MATLVKDVPCSGWASTATTAEAEHLGRTSTGAMLSDRFVRCIVGGAVDVESRNLELHDIAKTEGGEGCS